MDLSHLWHLRMLLVQADSDSADPMKKTTPSGVILAA
jgi:hypothetical protein